jgi:hypothetical protein
MAWDEFPLLASSVGSEWQRRASQGWEFRIPETELRELTNWGNQKSKSLVKRRFKCSQQPLARALQSN